MKEKFLKALQDKDFAELFKKGGVSFLMRVGGLVMGFVITFIIAHYFGAKGLGDYVLAVIVLRVFVLIAKLGMDTASIRFIAEYASKNYWEGIELYRSKVSLVLFVSSILFSIIMFLSASYIANIIGANPTYIKLNSFFIMPMAFFILNYQSLRGLKKIAEFSFFYWMSRVTFSAIIILIAVQFSQNENITIFAFLLGLLIVSALSYFIFRNSLNLKKGLNNQPMEYKTITVGYKEIFVVSFPLLLAQSGQFIMAWTDKLMLGGLMTSADVGVYDVAFKLSMFVNIALTSISSITSPKFAEMYSIGDMTRLKKVVHQATKITFWSTLPLFIGFLLLSPFLLSIFGEEFKTGFYVLCFLSLARLISALTGPAGNLLQMTGKQVVFMNVLFVGAFINIILNFLLIPIYGIEGAALASMGSIVFWNITMVYYVKKEFGFLTIYNPFKKS
jgi:O-antigen/teichoic acid export membrane protein